jgi:hypothetical protein
MMKMKKYWFAFLLFAGNTFFVLGQETMSLEPFTKVKASNNVTVELIQTNESPRLSYEILAGDKDNVLINQVGDRLDLSVRSNWGGKTKVAFKVYYREIEQLKAGSGASINCMNCQSAKAIKLDAESGGNIVGHIKSPEVYAESASGGTIEVVGTTDKAILKSQSGANLDARELRSTVTYAKASSGANMKVYAQETLSATAESGGTINYYGKPKQISVDKLSSGSVKGIDK